MRKADSGKNQSASLEQRNRKAKRLVRIYKEEWQKNSYDGLVLYREPVSSIDFLCAATVDHLNGLRLTESWFAEIPRLLLSCNPAVIAAATAFVSSNRFALQCNDANVQSCLRSYVRAVENQRQLVSSSQGSLSDEAVMTCALLAHFERTMGRQACEDRLEVLFNTLIHLRSMERMVVDRLKLGLANELDYTLITGHYMLLLEAPIATGVPSPYERLASADPQSILANKSMRPAKRLRRLASELMLHAPRLIADARGYASATTSKEHQQQTINRALRLLALRDDEAESEVLHNVKISKASSGGGVSFTPLVNFYFTFATLADFDASLNYWHARMLILRICWKLRVASDPSVVSDEGRRIITNILMAWQYGLQQSVFGLIRLLHSSCSLWGGVSDFGLASKLPKNAVRTSLIFRINELYASVVGETTEAQLDQVSAVYAGGPLEGPLVKMYQRFWVPTTPASPR